MTENEAFDFKVNRRREAHDAIESICVLYLKIEKADNEIQNAEIDYMIHELLNYCEKIYFD